MQHSSKYYQVLSELATFVKVVRQGSLAGAARELGVPKSTVSRRLDRLERALNSNLLRRGPRKFELTRDGAKLFDNVHVSLEQLENALQRTKDEGSQPKGNVRITAPPDFGRIILLPELTSFRKKWPEITFDIELSNRYVNLFDEQYDLAIRAWSGSQIPGDNQLITRKLYSSRLCLVGSRRMEPPTSLEALAAEPFILFRATSHTQSLELTTPSGKKQTITVKGAFNVSDYTTMATLVADGEGVGLLPELHLTQAQEKLHCILPGYHVPSSNLSILYSNRQLPRRVSLLLEHLTHNLSS